MIFMGMISGNCPLSIHRLLHCKQGDQVKFKVLSSMLMIANIATCYIDIALDLRLGRLKEKNSRHLPVQVPSISSGIPKSRRNIKLLLDITLDWHLCKSHGTVCHTACRNRGRQQGALAIALHPHEAIAYNPYSSFHPQRKRRLA